MGEDGWELIAGADPAVSVFPLRARIGGEHIIIFKTPAGFRGVQRNCPHQNATLVDAQVAGGGTMIRCSQHSYTFRLRNGKGVNCPGYRIAVFDVKQDGQALYGRPVAENSV